MLEVVQLLLPLSKCSSRAVVVIVMISNLSHLLLYHAKGHQASCPLVAADFGTPETFSVAVE